MTTLADLEAKADGSYLRAPDGHVLERSPMDRKAQLQFRLLTADAQRSAIRRLALKGLDDEEIASTTGWTTSEVRRVLERPSGQLPPPWALGKSRRSRSAGGSIRS